MEASGVSFDYSQVDVVCFYVNLGREGYAPLMTDMAASAKKAMPGCRVVLLSPNPTDDVCKPFDVLFKIGCSTEPQYLCLERGRAHIAWMQKTDRPCVLADPDLIFTGQPPFDHGEWDIALSWRGKPDQPVNSGSVLAFPGYQKFWWHYGAVMVNLPPTLRAWWCDQLAFSIMTGACHNAGEILQLDDARVKLLDSYSNCATEGAEQPGAWAIHRKGRRKGDGWEEVFKEDINEPLPPGVSKAGPVA